MRSMRVSVAMCTFNGERFIMDQLASVARQSRRPDELIICDDASTDGTWALLEKFARTAPFPTRTTRNPTRLGVMKNFENAIAACEGDVIVLSDQDDVWNERKLAVIARALSGDSSLAAVFHNARRIGANGERLDGNLWEHVGFTPPQRQLVSRGRAFEVLLERNVVTGATLAFRTRWREAILPMPDAGRMLHDEWIALVLSGASRINCLDEFLIDYREHDQQHRGAGEAVGGVGQWVEAARNTTASAYATRAAQLQLLHERLTTIPETPLLRLQELKHRIEHLRIRGAMPPNRIKRIPSVMRELAALRYFRYSNHLFSAGKDLFWK